MQSNARQATLTLVLGTLSLQVPVFARSGAVIPMLPRNLTSVPGVSAQQFSDIVWQLWPGSGIGIGTLYEDDGISTDYLAGTYAVTKLTAEPVGADCNDISILTQVTMG
jgi:alpha-glucosidase (family GH31 glycosyl hydrolase)